LNEELRGQYNQFLTNISDELDIAPSKYQQAVERYEAVGRLIEASDYEGQTDLPSIYVQGSFRLGTVVRPLKEGEESDYDIDLVSELQIDKSKTTPEVIKTMIGDTLRSNGTYLKLLQDEGRRCWTLQYAEADGVGFHLDVLPSLPEDRLFKLGLTADGVKPQLADKAITITHKNGNGTYEWSQSNSNGYADWFYERMQPAFYVVAAKQRQQIFEENRQIYARVDAVPNSLIKTPLQRAIQILKRHRDMRFAGHAWEQAKPISMIITTLAALFYQQEDDVLTALENIINGLIRYAAFLDPDFSENNSLADLTIIARQSIDGRWKIPNPVNPAENFADRWHEDNNLRARAFFRWVTWVHQDLIDILPNHDHITVIGKKLEERFGSRIVSQAANGLFILGAPSIALARERETPKVELNNPSRPWGTIES
jgi:hypothetical protein